MARVYDELTVICAPFPAGPPILRRCQAMRAAIAGDRATADAAALAFEADPRHCSGGWHAVETLRARGLAALFERDWEAAATFLGQVVGRVRGGGVRDPGIFPAAPDLIEALVAAGRIREAEEVLAELQATAVEQNHPWALAAAPAMSWAVGGREGRRGERGDLLQAAATAFTGLGLRFDAVRARLDLGIVHRRERHRQDARRELSLARDEFEALGAPVFAARAQAEIDRLGGRTATVG